jgi:hypothetical protein
VGECVFANPVGDLALLSSPDNQELDEEADAYETLTETVSALPISYPPKKGPDLRSRSLVRSSHAPLNASVVR